MIQIIRYEVFDGEEDEIYHIDRKFRNDKEVEQFRKELEDKHQCFKTDFTGTKRVKQILFQKIEEP